MSREGEAELSVVMYSGTPSPDMLFFCRQGEIGFIFIIVSIYTPPTLPPPAEGHGNRQAFACSLTLSSPGQALPLGLYCLIKEIHRNCVCVWTQINVCVLDCDSPLSCFKSSFEKSGARLDHGCHTH